MMYSGVLLMGSSFAMMNERQVKPWSSGNIQMSDFKGAPHLAEQEAIHQHSFIDYNIEPIHSAEDPLRVNSEAVMDQQKSWISGEDVSNGQILYQQMKFNLTKVYSHRFQTRIQESGIKAGNFNEIGRVHKEISEALQQEQNRMDAETRMGGNAIEQKKWKERIESQLNNGLK